MHCNLGLAQMSAGKVRIYRKKTGWGFSTHVVSWNATNSILGSLMKPPPFGAVSKAAVTCSAYVLHGIPAHSLWKWVCSIADS